MPKKNQMNFNDLVIDMLHWFMINPWFSQVLDNG
jgi:hypothetical protein